MVLTETHNLQFFRRKIKFCDFCQKNTILETVEENIFFKKKKDFTVLVEITQFVIFAWKQYFAVLMRKMIKFSILQQPKYNILKLIY